MALAGIIIWKFIKLIIQEDIVGDCIMCICIVER